MKTITKDEAFSVIDREIKKQIQRKNAFIEKNGFSNVDAIRRFDSAIAALSGLYGPLGKAFLE